MSKASPETWRARVVEMLSSGLPAKSWADRHSIPWATFAYHVKKLLEMEPRLFTLSRYLCACPVMARTLPYGNPEIREYLKHAYFELAAFPGNHVESLGRLTGQRSTAFRLITDHLPTTARPSDVSLEFLSAVGSGASKEPATLALRAAVLAASSSGVHDGGSFFRWASEHDGRIRAARNHGQLLRAAVEGSGYERMRVVRCQVRGSDLTEYSLFEFDTLEPFCQELLDGFMETFDGVFHTSERFFFSRFTESLGFTPNSLGDFSPETFGRQVKWFDDNYRGSERQRTTRMTKLFYMHLTTLLPPDQRTFTFETGLPPKALAHSMIAGMWLEGYRAVIYEPLDPEPRFPKWLLYPNENETIKASYSSDTPKTVDCSVDDPELERLLIGWVWRGGLDSFTARVAPAWVRVLLQKTIDGGVSLVRGGTMRRVVDAGCLNAALATLAERNCDSSRRRLMNTMRAFLAYAEKEGGLVVEPACYLLLENENGFHEGSWKDHDAVPDEHLSALADELERASSLSVIDELAYVAYITQALTEIRHGEVLSLRVSDLDAGHREDFKAVRVCRKSAGYNYEVIEVPAEVLRLLKAAVRITEPVRERADESISDYVFLVEGDMGFARVLSVKSHARRLALACERLGIPTIKPGDVRRAYQTTVIMEGAKRNWNRLMLRRITGHSKIKSDEPYITPDIMSPETRRYLEGAFVVEIGNPRIRGKVLGDDELPDDAASLVEGGAGVCRNEECDILGTLPCYECPGFATAPRFVPEMLEAVAVLDRQIASAPLHQREHLMRAKRHVLAYVGKMVDMGKEG